MKNLFVSLMLMFAFNSEAVEDKRVNIWNKVDRGVAENIFDYMKQQMQAPEILPMPEVVYDTTYRSDLLMQYMNVGQTFGTNMPYIRWTQNVRREQKDMITFYLAHEFAHYLFHARQNQYLYPRAGNQYWNLVEFNHHCDKQFIQLLDNVADYMKQNNLTQRTNEMKNNTRYNCKVAGNE